MRLTPPLSLASSLVRPRRRVFHPAHGSLLPAPAAAHRPLVQRTKLPPQWQGGSVCARCSCHRRQRRPPASTRSWQQRWPPQWKPASSPIVHASTALDHMPTFLDRSCPRLHHAGAPGPVPRRPGALTSNPPGVLRDASTWRASGLHRTTRLQWRAPVAVGRPRAATRHPLHPQHWRDWWHQ
jgi:hypothetical protein